MRINKAYQEMFPNNCPVIEVTGDGVEVGTCTHYMPNGVCPRHGRLSMLDLSNDKIGKSPRHIVNLDHNNQTKKEKKS